MSPTIQPGIKVRRVGGQPGTFGAFALHKTGRVVLIGAEHTITNHWRARLGDPLVLEPTDSSPQITRSLRIKGVKEDLPAVLKQPADAVTGMKVVKYGWATEQTEGRILAASSSANVKYQDGRVRRVDNLILAEIKSDHGDSGSILLSVGDYTPVGFLEAKHEIYSNICYFVKAKTIANKQKLSGFFCPIGIPQDCPETLETVIKHMIPDGYFEQIGDCRRKDWRRIAKTIGLVLPDIEQVEPFRAQESEPERSLQPGQEVHYVGRLVLNRQNKVVSLVHAGSDKMQLSTRISMIEAALDLKLIGAFGW